MKYTGTHPKGSSQSLAAWWFLHVGGGGTGRTQGVSCTCADAASNGESAGPTLVHVTFQLQPCPSALVPCSCWQVLCAVVFVHVAVGEATPATWCCMCGVCAAACVPGCLPVRGPAWLVPAGTGAAELGSGTYTPVLCLQHAADIRMPDAPRGTLRRGSGCLQHATGHEASWCYRSSCATTVLCMATHLTG